MALDLLIDGHLRVLPAPAPVFVSFGRGFVKANRVRHALTDSLF
jgi:hypothetical protein